MKDGAASRPDMVLLGSSPRPTPSRPIITLSQSYLSNEGIEFYVLDVVQEKKEKLPGW